MELSFDRKTANQVTWFCRDIAKGDIIIAYSESHVMGIAQVEDNEVLEKPIGRRVMWLDLEKWRPEKRFMKVLATYDTVHKITDTATVEMIKKRFAA